MSDENTDEQPEVKEAVVLPTVKVEPLPDQTPDHLKNPNGDDPEATVPAGEVDAPKAD